MGNADKNEARLEREWRSNVATVALWRGRGGREWRKLIRAERDVLLDICTYTSPTDMRWKSGLEDDRSAPVQWPTRNPFLRPVPFYT